MRDGASQRLKHAFRAQRAAGRTAETIAREMGVNANTIRNYSSGRRLPRSIETWQQLAEALHTTESYLLFGDEESDEIARIRLDEMTLAVSAQVAKISELLQPLLESDPTERDLDALRELGRALGRAPKENRRNGVPPKAPGKAQR